MSDVNSWDHHAHLQLLAQQAALRQEVAAIDADIRRDVQSTSADGRREAATDAGAIRRDVAFEGGKGVDTTKTASWNVADRVGTEADRVVAQDTAYFIAAQSQNFSNATALAALKASTDAQSAKTQADVAAASATAVAASTLAGEKNATATALAAAQTQQLIMNDGAATRALINALNADELNRKLIERNAALIEAREGERCCHNQLNATLANAQNNQVLSAINAFQSQLNETRQSVNNFGTYLGTQTSSPVNVR